MAMDFDPEGPDAEFPAEAWGKSILNILEANDFDAIPLVTARNERPSRIARRRYHMGDHSDMFVLGIEEVSVFGPESSIIDVVFSVLSNEHHIALVEFGGDIESIVTLDTLASPGVDFPFLRRYLDQKVADVSSTSGKELPADLGRRAFDGIRSLANLVDGDRTKVPEEEFAKMAVDLLVLLKPLEDHSKTEVDREPVSGRRAPRVASGDVIASDFMRPFMVGVREEELPSVAEDARDSLSMANDFSNILILSSEREPVGLFRKSGEGWLREEVGLSTWGAKIENVLGQLSNMDRRGTHPLVVFRMKEGGFGIITQDEASSDVPVFWLLKRLAVLENRCRKWLESEGGDEVRYSYRSRKDMIPVGKASFGQILHHEGMFSDALPGVDLVGLVHFRNDIVHSVIADREPLDLGDLSMALRSMRALEDFVPSSE